MKNHEIEKEEKVAELHEDIYTLTFINFYQNDNPLVRKDLAKRSLITLSA